MPSPAVGRRAGLGDGREGGEASGLGGNGGKWGCCSQTNPPVALTGCSFTCPHAWTPTGHRVQVLLYPLPPVHPGRWEGDMGFLSLSIWVEAHLMPSLSPRPHTTMLKDTHRTGSDRASWRPVCPQDSRSLGNGKQAGRRHSLFLVLPALFLVYFGIYVPV